MAASRPSRRGFTLTELMVAVIVLLVVIVATSKIFGTASKVTGLGQAGAAVLQEAAAIERRIRADFQALSREGFFAIRCVAVRNSVNLADGGPLLDPGLKPGDWIRADQIVFFTNGVQSVQGFRGAAGVHRKGQGTAARIYYGHAFQVPQGPPAEWENAQLTHAIDLVIDPADPVVPWYLNAPPFRKFQEVKFQKDAGTPPGDYEPGNTVDPVNVTQPPAPSWLLARQPVALVDDGGSPNDYLDLSDQVPPPPVAGGVRSTAWIGNDEIVNGRVDASSARLGIDGPSGLGAIRVWVSDVDTNGIINGIINNWHPDQRTNIGSLVFYPRAERHAPGMSRVDQSLTSHTLAAGCSSFTVDWTYADNVGSTTTNPPDGVQIVTAEQPWFGLDPDDDGEVGKPGLRGVRTFANYVNDELGNEAKPVLPPSIERLAPELSVAGREIRNYAPSDVIVYEAFFGYNQGHPFDATGTTWGASDPAAYTPLPSAVRVTMTLHDPAGKLAAGRVVQMVFDLPRGG